jgi:hypothetical protein
MIDDIDFLRENSEKDTALIFIDSKNRDYVTFPTPSEYSVTFDQPFKNVYSVEILDASIPTTMYAVDIYNKYLWFTMIGKPSQSTVDPQTYIQEISECVFFIRLFQLPTQYYIIVCDEAHLSGFTLDNVNESVYVAALRKTIENTNIIKYIDESPEEFYIFTHDGENFCVKNVTANSAIIDILKLNNFTLVYNASGKYDLIYYEFLYITSNTYNFIKSSDNYWVNIINYRVELPMGNYDVSDFRFELNKLLNNTHGVFFESVGGQDTRQSRYKMYSSNLFILDASKGSLDFTLGYDLLPSSKDADLYIPFKVGNNSHLFMGKYFINEQAYSIVSPGILNLSGERFLILRCPEIEGHLYGSYSYVSNTTGIGMFKLAAGQNEITNLRWDFSTLVKKPIHPIGKLVKLTFRFELPSGNLYDFKGINHQFMLAIKFYIPSQKRNFTKSILNPNYNPNLVEYITKEKNKENSDNEEDDVDDERYNFYRKQLELQESDEDSE